MTASILPTFSPTQWWECVYINCVGIHNPYLLSVRMWVRGNMSPEHWHKAWSGFQGRSLCLPWVRRTPAEGPLRPASAGRGNDCHSIRHTDPGRSVLHLSRRNKNSRRNHRPGLCRGKHHHRRRLAHRFHSRDHRRHPGLAQEVADAPTAHSSSLPYNRLRRIFNLLLCGLDGPSVYGRGRTFIKPTQPPTTIANVTEL